MPFRSLLHTAVFVIPVLLFECNQKKEHPKPNVLFIMVDDLNDHLGCLRDSVVQTPNIDKLAEKGTLFENAYCQYSLCNPSRVSMLTGVRPTRLGITSLKGHFRDEHPEIITMPQLFRENDYFTARAGKIYHMGVPDAIAVRGDGKDDPKSWDEAINPPGFELNSNGYFYNATPWETHQVGTGGAISWLRAEKGDELQHDYNVASEIIAMMKEHKDKPFFLAAGFIRPHVPLVAPKRFFERYDSVETQLPVYRKNDRNDIPPMAIDTWAANFNIPEYDRERAIIAYNACITFMDGQVGRLLNALETEGIDNNTIVVFVSDHGFQLGEHGLWFKNYLFRESAIAPVIIYDPRIENQSGRTVKAVELLDIYPTLTELCNLESPEHLEGQSLVPLIHGNGNKDFAIIETYRNGKLCLAVYTSSWSYMLWDNGNAGEELYHLKSDPGQFRNLAENKNYIVVKDSLYALLKEMVSDYFSSYQNANNTEY